VQKPRPRGADNPYGWDHQQLRAQWAPLVATGQIICRRAPYGECRARNPYIRPDEPWDLGDPDETVPAPKAPEHRGCNRSTGLTNRRQARNQQTKRRRWVL